MAPLLLKKQQLGWRLSHRRLTKMWRAPWWWAFEIHHFPEQLFFCLAAAMLAALVFVRLQAPLSTLQKGAAASEQRFMSLLGEQWKSLKPLIET